MIAARPLTPPSPPLQASAPSPYIDGTKVQFAWDSTSLGAYLRCPREYFLGQVRGLKRKKQNTNITFGAAFAKAMETYEKARSATGDHRVALDQALGAAAEISVGMEDYKAKTRDSLQRSVAAYLVRHEQDELTTISLADGRPAVELSFQAPMNFEVCGTPVIYCGHIDRMVDFQGVPYVLDNKTTGASISTEKGSAAYFAQFTPDVQMSGYTWGAREAFGVPVRGVIVDAMQVAKTKTEFGRAIAHRTEGMLRDWLDTTEAGVRQAAASAMKVRVGDNISDQARAYPQNPTSCHKYGGCRFRGVCGKDPSVRENFIETEFESVMWNPLAPRNEGAIDVTEEGQDAAE